MEELISKIWELLTIYGLKVIAAIVVFIVGRWIAKGLTKFTENLMNKRQVDPTLVSFVVNMTYIALLVFVVLAALFWLNGCARVNIHSGLQQTLVQGDCAGAQALIEKSQSQYGSNAELLYLGHHNGVKAELTGFENLQINNALRGSTLSEEQLYDALEEIGLGGREDLPTQVLSQGQKRRVALARLLVSEARLWVLDEPFTALDKAAVGFLQSVIQGHVDNGGMVMLTTHQEVSLTQGEVKRLHLGKRI